MRRFLPSLIVLTLIISAAVIAYTYEIPEVSIFQTFQSLDEKIVRAEVKSEEPLEFTLEKLHEEIRGLIIIGQTYEGTNDLTESFASFDESYALLKFYTEDVARSVITEMEKTNFSKIDQHLTVIDSDLVALTEEIVKYHQSRYASLVNLEVELIELVKTLETFEEMFYHTKTSETVTYFQGINARFVTLQSIHTEYMQANEQYYEKKAMYYEKIANRSMFDYISN